MRLASIRIETAGGSGNENENAASTVSRRWFLPVVSQSHISTILEELRPGMQWADAAPKLVWHGVSPQTEKRLSRIAFLWCVLISGVGLALTRPWGAVGGLVFLPILLFLVRRQSRARRYGRTDWGIAYRSGLLTRKLSFAFYDRIQAIEVQQTPFDRRWKMAQLHVDTAASGPAEHTIDISYLVDEFAFGQFDEIQQSAAQHQPTWT